MKNAGIVICLHSKNRVIPECVEGKTHLWEEIESPMGNEGGWHTDECCHCKVRREYDTTD